MKRMSLYSKVLRGNENINTMSTTHHQKTNPYSNMTPTARKGFKRRKTSAAIVNDETTPNYGKKLLGLFGTRWEEAFGHDRV